MYIGCMKKIHIVIKLLGPCTKHNVFFSQVTLRFNIFTTP